MRDELAKIMGCVWARVAIGANLRQGIY